MNDLHLIERLRAAGTDTPASRHTPDAVLAAGRRAQARRNVLRISGASLSVAAVLVAGMQLTPGNAGTQTVTAAGDGAPGDGPAPAPPVKPGLDPDADRVNAAILQAALGDDFDVLKESPNGKLRPGTESADGLPDIYGATASLMASVSNAQVLKKQCAPMEEKGAIFDSCVTRTLPDGQEVQAQFSRWAPTEKYPQDTAGEAVRVLFLQPDGVLVAVDLVTSTDADDSTGDSAADAKTWLDSMVDRLGAAATDPDVAAMGFDATEDPAAKPPATAEDEATARKIAEAKKAAAEKEAAESGAAPADEKAIAAKKAAAAEAEAMDAKKAAAEKCAAAGKC